MAVSYNKTAGTVLIALQNIAGSAVPLVGGSTAEAGAILVSWSVDFGRRSSTIFTNAPYITLQGAKASSPTPSDWVDLDVWQPNVGATIITQAITSNTSGSTIPMTTTTGFAIQQFCYIDDGANSEWFEVAAVTASTSLTSREALTNVHASAINVYSQAEFYAADVSPNYAAYRAIVDNSNNAINIACRVRMNVVNSIG
jgi:hypothetical protein